MRAPHRGFERAIRACSRPTTREETTPHERLPQPCPLRRHRLRHRRQQPRLPPDAARLDRHRARSTRARCRTRAARPATPRTSSSRRPLQGDDAAHARERRASTASWASSPSAAASRSRAPRSAWRSCAGGWRRRSRGASSRRSLVTPAEIKELVPYIDETILLGGFYTPGVGVVDSLRAGTIMRETGDRVGRADACSRTPRCTGHRRRARARSGACTPRAGRSRPRRS